MTKRSMLTVVIMALLIPLNEVHKLWDGVSFNISPFWFTDYTLDIQWFVKFLGDKISWCIAAAVFFRLSRWNKEIRTAAIVFFVYTVIDLLLFFMWFNQKNYLLVYSSFCFITVAIMYWKMQPEKKPSKEQKVQECDARKDAIGSTVRYIKKQLEVRVD
jgi:hypothetical protein